MLRDSSFLENVPEDHRKLFVDGAPVAPAKLKVLKDMIRKKFSVNLRKYHSYMWILFSCWGKHPKFNSALWYSLCVHLKRFSLVFYYSL